MTNRRSLVIVTALIVSVCLLSASVTAAALAKYYDRAYMQALGQVCRSVIEKVDEEVRSASDPVPDSIAEVSAPSAESPSVEQAVLSALKEFRYDPRMPLRQNILFAYGYCQSGILSSVEGRGRFMILTAAAAGGSLLLFAAFLWHRKETLRIEALTGYLEQVNAGRDGVLLQTGEDALSGLQDEIYKTVTALHQTKDAALRAKENFAENLYNIAHQIKTPITAISLSMQLLQEENGPGSAKMQGQNCREVTRQLSNLTRLEEALLLLSRIDTGTLTLERREVDVFTLLMLSAENLQELFYAKEILVEIPEAGEKIILADMEWTMEAVMNLLKNCMEHTPPGGVVRCAYEQNPLYTLIRIWDTGPGFAREDMPHLFERFYRGKDAARGGIGIGLALAREIIERQNGTLLACNLPEGGACFEIRLYCH